MNPYPFVTFAGSDEIVPWPVVEPCNSDEVNRRATQEKVQWAVTWETRTDDL